MVTSSQPDSLERAKHLPSGKPVAPDLLLQEFDSLADAPEAVSKLRALVLDLAVRGRLVAPAPKPDENPQWLKFCSEFTDEALRPGVPPPPPFEAPGHWRWAPLDEVAEPCGQKKPDARFTYIDVGSIDNARGLITTDVQTLSPDEAPSRARKLVRLNSVICSTVRPYLRNIAVIDRNFSPAPIVSTAFAVLHPHEFLESRYLFYWLRSQPFQEDIAAKMKGVAYPAISDSDFWQCQIAVPPPEEQRRIVAKVEELLSLCDELDAHQAVGRERRARLAYSALDHLTAAKDEQDFRKQCSFILHNASLILDSVTSLRQAILSLAAQGRLVPRQQKEGVGHDLITRLSLREQPDPDHILDESFPEHWGITAFSNLARIRSGVTKGRNLAGRETAAFPYLRVANVQRGWLELDVMKDIEIPAGELEKYRLEPNDLLITEGGDWDKVGRTAIWRGEIRDCIHQNHVFRGRLVSAELPPEWFMLYFNSPVGRRYFEAAAKQTTNLASINATELRECPVPIPPIAEQKRIIAKVEDLIRWCDQLETHLDTAQTAGSHLLDATVRDLLS